MQKQDFQTLINDDRIYTKAIGYTKSVTLKQNGTSVAVATFIYINQLYKDLYTDGEYFFVGLDLEGDNVLRHDGVQLLLYNPQSLQFGFDEKRVDFYAAPIEITLIEKDQFKELPLRNNWSSYYLVKFEKREANTLKLRFGNRNLGYQDFTIIKDREKN